MKSFLAVLKKELKGYIDQPMAYILAIVFLVLNNFFFFRSSFLEEIASLRSMFQLLPWIMLFFVSALTMRTWAEEKRENTLSVLLSYPIKVWQIILGKYAATVLYVLLVLALTLIIPITLSGAGNFDWGVILAQYLGAAFLVMAMVAIGQWASSLTKNQVIAFILSVAALFGFVVIGLDTVVLTMPYPVNTIFQQLGILSHYQSLTRGLLDARDILYFVSLGFVFLSLSFLWLIKIKRSTKSKEWRTLQATVAILIAIAVVVNLFGQSFTVRADLTEQNIYTLSPATRNVIREVDDTVRLTLYRSRKLPTQIELVSRDVEDILKDYQRFSGGNVQFDIKYPDQDEDVAEEAQSKGIRPVRFNVVRQDEFSLQQGYLGLAIEYLDQSERLPFIQQIDDLEYKLTRAIMSLQSDEQKTLGVVSDFGGTSLDGLPSFAQAVREQFTVQNVTLSSDSEEGEETEAPSIDENVDVLMIAAPTQQYSEAAVQAVRDYVNNGGKVFWMLSGVTVDQQQLSVARNQTGLEPILSEQGIEINNVLAADLNAHQTVNFSSGDGQAYLLPYPFWTNATLNDHVIAGNLQQATMPWPSTLTVPGDNENVQTLAATSDGGVVQEDSFNIRPNNLESLQSLEQRQRVLAATVSGIEAAQGEEIGRWVVFANNNFLGDSILQRQPQNASLALNALDWLSQNEALISIRTKGGRPAGLVWESEAKQIWVKWGNIVGVPAGVAVFGIIWMYRRKRKAKASA